MLQDVADFVERIASPGAVNALSQALLRITSPGVPDLYQGTEYWDFSLVDPDNRRPVDFAARQASLAAGDSPAALLPHWKDGRVKQAVIARALRFRAESAGCSPRAATRRSGRGPRADHVLAFARVHEGRACHDRRHPPAGRFAGIGGDAPGGSRGLGWNLPDIPRNILGTPHC